MADTRQSFGGPYQLYFFIYEIYMVVWSYRVFAEDIKSLLKSALISLETRLKVPILAIF